MKQFIPILSMLFFMLFITAPVFAQKGGNGCAVATANGAVNGAGAGAGAGTAVGAAVGGVAGAVAGGPVGAATGAVVGGVVGGGRRGCWWRCCGWRGGKSVLQREW